MLARQILQELGDVCLDDSIADVSGQALAALIEDKRWTHLNALLTAPLHIIVKNSERTTAVETLFDGRARKPQLLGDLQLHRTLRDVPALGEEGLAQLVDGQRDAAVTLSEIVLHRTERTEKRVARHG